MSRASDTADVSCGGERRAALRRLGLQGWPPSVLSWVCFCWNIRPRSTAVPRVSRNFPSKPGIATASPSSGFGEAKPGRSQMRLAPRRQCFVR
jgi:hypothetical protein